MKLRLLAATVAALTLAAGIALAQDTTSREGQAQLCVRLRLRPQPRRERRAGGRQHPRSRRVQDGYAKKQPAMPPTSCAPRSGIPEAPAGQDAKAKAEFDKAAAENKTKSDTFLAANKAKPGVKTLPSGVQYRVIETGTGAKPTAGQHACSWKSRPVSVRPASASRRARRSRPRHQDQRSRDAGDARSAAADAGRFEVGSRASRRTRPTATTRAPASRRTWRSLFEIKLISVK